jgi:hypothetical protein
VEAVEVVVSTVAQSAKTRLFAVEGGEFDSREATISSLFFFTILLSVCTKRKKSELYFNVGILNAKHTSDG